MMNVDTSHFFDISRTLHLFRTLTTWIRIRIKSFNSQKFNMISMIKVSRMNFIIQLEEA